MKSFSALLLAFFIFLTSCNYMGGRGINGDGNLGTQNRNIGDFNGIRVVGGMDVILVPGSTNAIRVEADQNLLEYIETNKVGSTVEVAPRKGFRLHPRAGMKIYLTTPAINNIEVVGSGSVNSQGKINGTPRLKTEITGSGDIKLDVDAPQIETETTGSGKMILSGNTRDFRAEINGSGDVYGFNLLSENTSVEISGSGKAQVYASKQLKVDVSGAGDIEYKGNPSVSQDISGSGSVRKVQ